VKVNDADDICKIKALMRFFDQSGGVSNISNLGGSGPNGGASVPQSGGAPVAGLPE